MMKKVMAVMMMLLLLCQPGVFASDESISADSGELSMEMSLLEYIGIITPFEDGAYHLDHVVSRADMAVMIMKLIMKDTITSSATGKIFTDVPKDYWAADYIETLHATGYISGDGNSAFDPEGAALYQHAMKILVTTLGYQPLAENAGGYPVGYMAVAARLGLNRNVRSAADSKLTYSDMYNMLYHTLTAKRLVQTSYGERPEAEESDRTILESSYSIFAIRGRVDADELSYLSDRRKMPGGEIRIDGAAYRVAEGVEAANLLGVYVEGYARITDDEKEIILLARDEKYENITVQAKDVDRSSGGFGDMMSSPAIAYYEKGDRLERISVLKTASIIRNGTYVGRASEVANEMVIPSFGSVELLENSSGEYDVIRISSYEYYVIQSLDKARERLTDKFGKPELDLGRGGDFSYNIFSGGERISFGDLIEGDVLAVGANYDDWEKADFIQIYRSTASVKGKITQLSDEEAMIDETVYPLAGEVVCSDGVLEAGRSGTFYLGVDGEIVSAALDKKNVDGYAYLRKMQVDKQGIDPQVSALLFTTNNTMEIIPFAEEVSLNGSHPIARDEAANSPALRPNGVVKEQFVKIERNRDGEITGILTEGEPGGITQNASGLNNCYINKYAIGAEYLADDNTWVFSIPIHENAKDNEFSVQSARQMAAGLYSNLSIYDVDEHYTAGVLALRKGSTFLSISLGSRSAALVEKVSDSLVDGEGCKRAYVLIDGVFTYVDIPKEMYQTMKDTNGDGKGDKGVVAGDVFLFSADANRVALSVEVLFDSVKDQDRMFSEWYVSTGGMTEAYTNNALLYTAHAIVDTVDGNILLLRQNCLVNGAYADVIRPYRMEGVRVYIYDKNAKKTVRNGYLGDVKPGQRVFIRGARTILREIIIYE